MVLSMVGSFVTLDDTLYIVQKYSVFNQYGVKLGWMWTCLIVGPFIWFSSRAHHRYFDHFYLWVADAAAPRYSH
ncbi:hypothetical protein COOONC_25184 [Cooperia oncophora]